MAKSCCGGPRPVVYTPGSTRGNSKPGSGGPAARSIPESIEDGGIVANIPVEFTGTRKGAFTIYGPVSKAPYRFSVHDRVTLVDERDVPQMVANRDFQLYGRPKQQAVRPPEPRRGDPPNINKTIASPQSTRVPVGNPNVTQVPAISPAAIAAKEAAELARKQGQPATQTSVNQEPRQRMIPRRNEMGSVKPKLNL